MPIARTFRFLGILPILFLVAGSARAALVELTITGTGANGTIGSGSFTVEDGDNIHTPGYYAPGSIYYDGWVTLTNIPGGGPSSVTFNLADINSTVFMVDSNSVQFLGPSGGHSFGFPDQNHYDLSPSQPFYPSSYVFQTTLSYNGSTKDVITWSPASPASVPEPGSSALMVTGLVAAAGAFRRRTRSAV